MKSSLYEIKRWVIVLIVSMLFSTVVFANSAEPPSFTIIVTNPPEDLALTVEFRDDVKLEGVRLEADDKMWETYYRFYHSMFPRTDVELEDAVLVVESSVGSFQCPLPTETLHEYNNLLTLDIEDENLKVGQKLLREPLLVTMRVTLTLLIEGVIFYLFGYRKKASWIAFLMINLVTQGGLNMLLTGPNLGSYWGFGFILGEILILIIELIVLTSCIKETRRRRTALYVVLANVLSLIVGGYLIAYLPI